jgi:hypothetical protein
MQSLGEQPLFSTFLSRSTVILVTCHEGAPSLNAMRGGAAAAVGVVTQIRLRLEEQPSFVTWSFQNVARDQLETVVACWAFTNAARLPKDISMSFRFQITARTTFIRAA